MQVNIRRGTKKDLPTVWRLIKELAEYEKAPHEVTLTLEQFEQDGFGERPLYEFLVAEEENQIVGMALFYFAYSTWKGKMIYLDDIIVTQEYRRKGIGKKLMDALINYAKEAGAKQLRWHVLTWNTPAINFYKKYNANLDPEWITCKLTEQQIKNNK